MTRVTVIGSFAVGLTIRPDRMPGAGETVLASVLDEGPGGKGSNQAVQIARLGVPVELVAVVGDDRLAEVAHALYREEGVGTAHLTVATGVSTGLGVIIVDDAGGNRILLEPGANRRLTPEHLRAAGATIRDSSVVLAQLEIEDAPVAAGFELARAAGATTILNPAPARPLAAELLREVDVLTPNETEARVLLEADEEDDDRVARVLLALGVGCVALTCGERGALVADATGVRRFPAPRVEVVDSTGAGDAFNGTLAASLAAGVPIDAAVERAVHAGALACTRLGVVPSLPYAADLPGGAR